jgi:hypothetical protein
MSATDRPDVVIDLGSPAGPEPTPPPATGWRVIAAAVAMLVVGLAAGYLVGSQRSRHAAAAPARSATPIADSSYHPPPVEPVSVVRQCAIQSGKSLQLGAEMTNESDQPLSVNAVIIVLPGTGLSVRRGGWGTCAEVRTPGGSMRDDVPPGPMVIPPGGSSWYTAEVNVLVTCPAGSPVEFLLRYDVGGQATSSVVRAFPDLGNISYSGCRHAGTP